MATAREEVHKLVDALPAEAVEQLAEIARLLQVQVAAGEFEEVTDPEEEAVILEALQEDPDEPAFTLEEARAYLEHIRRERRT